MASKSKSSEIPKKMNAEAERKEGTVRTTVSSNSGRTIQYQVMGNVVIPIRNERWAALCGI